MKRRDFLNLAYGTTGLFVLFGKLKKASANSSPYELWLVAVRSGTSSSAYLFEGHAFIALIKSDGSPEISETWGFWGNEGKNGLVTGSQYPDGFDFRIMKEISAGRMIAPQIAIRKSKVSNNRAEWIRRTAPGEAAGCDANKYAAVFSSGDNCNCVDYATRAWHYYSAKSEDFRVGVFQRNPGLFGGLSPAGVANAIDKKNRETGSDYLDKGKIWE